ncbi:Uu.00g065870.m01.CDS01 [Anthostomella pinea]|uniref:Amine oxidase n=1 Tax=Anthostomella pinea TaxID=933095 RepID=A0AAI8VTU2_9PEZI|nr:Uu.00g065870.m01.CDS01 [Anthostomella pinea]
MTISRNITAGILSSSIFLAAVGLLWLPARGNPGQLDVCPANRAGFKAPKRNVWAGISEHEANDVYDFLVKEWADLNVTRTPRTAYENFIFTVEALSPNKSDVLPFLWEDSKEPERWAKVVLSRNTEEKPQLIYHAVGPLPVSEATQVVPLTHPFSSGRNYVTNLMADFVGSLDFSLALAENVSDITTELLDAKVNRKNPYDPNSLQVFPRFTRQEPGLLIAWIQFFRPGMGSSGRTLLPQGIYVRVDATSANVSDWVVGDWFYNGVMYANVDEFRRAMRSPDFLKTPPNVDGPWTDTEDFDAKPDGRQLPPPVSIQPYGPRYKLDKAEGYMSWFGFEFYLTSTQATGVSLFDVRFKGERVMYELSLQEALAHYAGDDPMAGGQEFLDTFFGMGTNAFELLPGYDCPGYADYLNTKLHRGGKTETLPNNICVFEFTSDHLLSRHTAQYSVTASRNTYLTVRSVSTVGNYDYTIDYIFYLDGAIEVKVRASGYIYGAFYANNPNKNEDEYGHRIHDALSSSMHDHVISFKADLDIAGSANDLVRLALEPTVISYPWDQPYVKERNTMHLKEYPVTEEAGLEWPKNSGEFYIVYSSDQKNAWGEKKGYRVVSGTGMGNTPHLSILNSTTLGNSARWAEKDIWVVRQKDIEPRGADPLNYLEPLEPLIDFTTIANSESLAHGDTDSEYDGDLVIYFNVGSHHIPHSGDIPNTLMHTSSSSVMFVPHNFADRDPSRESVQGVRLQLKGKKSGGFAGWDPEGDEPNEELRSRGKDKNGGKYEMHEGANYFGTPYAEDVQLPLAALEPDLPKEYRSEEIRVSDLGLNGSAAGVWMRNP